MTDTMDSDHIAAILSFWFGPIADGDVVDGSKREMWFNGTPALDAEITNNFLGVYEDALAGSCSQWQHTAQGSLALVVLLDQFPLNMFRRSARAFESEHAAVAACEHAIEHGQDTELAFVERTFLYMPLMHAESTQHQAASVRHYSALVDAVPTNLREPAERTLSFAKSHSDIVSQFGRFPHRNKVLGRESRPEEIAFLDDNPASYGQ
ncbi:MAG: DUF924 family protein [Pseudomonadota bacterium]